MRRSGKTGRRERNSRPASLWLRAVFALSLSFACAAARADALMLWEVSAGGAPLWLFGSVHVCRPDCFPLPAAVDARFSRAEVLVVELDPSKSDVSAAMKRFASAEAPVRTVLSAAEWGRLNERFRAAGIPDASLARLGATTASLMLTMTVAREAGLSPEFGIDQHLIAEARARGKPLVELETVERQIAALGSGTAEQSLAEIRQTLAAAEDGSLRRQLEEIVAAWKAADAPRLARVLQQAEPAAEPLLGELLDRRNREMADALERLARGGHSVFAVIGSAHLAGPESIPSLLGKRGLSVRQLSSSDR
ncbi:TraB/GumN family protein [Niveibacterium terrae]|uniref:TraB/GumN family protein n=1 Tax=Niveibacterium terrae TaxID=3373598 RepID=UPI003A8C8BC2